MSIKDLIRACAETNDGAAWEEFVARFQRPISLSIKRTACQWGKNPEQFVDDLLQETYLKLHAEKCRLLLQLPSNIPKRRCCATSRRLRSMSLAITSNRSIPRNAAQERPIRWWKTSTQ